MSTLSTQWGDDDPSAWQAERAALQQRAFRRAVVASAALHGAGLLLLVGTPGSPLPPPAAAISVNLVAAPPTPAQRARARPAPPPKPVQKTRILPKRPQPLREKPVPAPEPEPAQPVDYEDAMAALREELGEELSESPEPAAPPAEGSGSEGEGQPTAWQLAAQNHIKRAWVTPPEFRNRGLVTVLQVALTSTGDVVGEPEVVRSSGDPYADDNAVRALLRASPLPPPPRPGDATIFFRPDE
ncbi:MAG: TonB C-terminal domain-containing protein [Proteobacteria bacterium]|nr:TonB C-terminal domain-containing protein [Pseudomonadota bacterium]